jgi:hypothetical protein
LNFYHNNLNFWYNFIKQKNINLVFSAVIPHVGFDFLIFHICKLYDIQNLSFYKLPTIKNNKLYKYLLSDYKNSFIKNPNLIGINEKNDLSFYKETYDTYYENKTFTGKEKIPFYIKFNIFSKLLLFVKKGILIKKIIFLLKYFKYNKNLNSIIKYTNPNLNVKYIYLPLHFQPEASTMPLAGFFSDQLLIIEYLASALPPNVFLYVKEHKRKSLIWFNLNRLKKILFNSNVVFISPNFSSVELTENSMAIATATGSTGWEALYKNKFVLVFGNIFYDQAPNVFKIKSTEYLKQVLLNILSNKIIFDKIKFERFVEMLEKNVIEGYSDLRYEANSQTTQEININNTYKLLKYQLDNLYVPVN